MIQKTQAYNFTEPPRPCIRDIIRLNHEAFVLRKTESPSAFNKRQPPDYNENIQLNQQKLVISQAEGFDVVNIDQIVYCKADGNYTSFSLLDGRKIISSHTLRFYENKLCRQSFFRIQRSYLINLNYVTQYRHHDGGMVRMSTRDEIHISRNCKEKFINLYKP